jgi:diguanylate cyclase (GGDEF)-like protein
LQHSSAVNALLAQKPYRADRRCEVEKNLCVALGENRLAFIPLRLKRDGYCWQMNDCHDKQCICHSSGRGPCWTQSEKHYRGELLGTYSEKAAKCLNCPAFFPLGVLAVKNTSTWTLSRVHAFLGDNFSGTLKNAVNFERALRTAAMDHLTGIHNKKSLITSVRSVLNFSTRHNQPLSFSMLDIDFFKKFNDTYGHQTGDFVLRGLAQLLSASVRASDMVARYGGEEFSINLPGTDKHTAFSVAKKLRKQVEGHVFKHGKQDLNITISVGISSFREDGIDSMAELIGKADAALYHSKELETGSRLMNRECQRPRRKKRERNYVSNIRRDQTARPRPLPTMERAKWANKSRPGMKYLIGPSSTNRVDSIFLSSMTSEGKGLLTWVL